MYWFKQITMIWAYRQIQPATDWTTSQMFTSWPDYRKPVSTQAAFASTALYFVTLSLRQKPWCVFQVYDRTRPFYPEALIHCHHFLLILTPLSQALLLMTSAQENKHSLHLPPAGGLVPHHWTLLLVHHQHWNHGRAARVPNWPDFTSRSPNSSCSDSPRVKVCLQYFNFNGFSTPFWRRKNVNRFF